MGTVVQKVTIPLLKSALSTEVERKKFDCTFVGEHFAVLKAVKWTGQAKREWQVTHRPTGRCAGTGFITKASAVGFAKWIEKRGTRLRVDWSCRSYQQLAKMEGWPKLKESIQPWRERNRASAVYPE